MWKIAVGIVIGLVLATAVPRMRIDAWSAFQYFEHEVAEAIQALEE